MNTTDSSPSIGMIGLGLMGLSLAERLLKSGWKVIGNDLDPGRAALLEKLGGHPVDRTEEIFQQSEIILFSVLTTEQVAAILNIHSNNLRAGQILIDTTTGDPGKISQLARSLEAADVAYLDATIAGNSDEARDGRVLALVGGSEAAFQKIERVLRAFAREVFHLGPSGNGAKMKLVFNLALGLHRAVLAEALVFSQKIGLPPESAWNILMAGAAQSGVMPGKGKKMLTGDFTPQAKLGQHLKDVDLMLNLARQHDADLPLTRLHQQLLTQSNDAGHRELDNAAILKTYEALNQIRLLPKSA